MSVSKSVPDPIPPGATCQVSEPISSGSYIFHEPSKYDQVFWPLTDEHVIEAALATELQEAERLEYLFLSAIYHRELSDLDKSKLALGSLEEALAASKDEKLKGFVEYLTELKGDVDKIVPGGPLIPDGE